MVLVKKIPAELSLEVLPRLVLAVVVASVRMWRSLPVTAKQKQIS